MKKTLTLLLCLATNFCFAQAVITKPNGDVIANPNLKKINTSLKINPTLLKNVNALKLSGKTTAEIVKALKAEKVTAKDAFVAIKATPTPDTENVAALCIAGYRINEIVDALVLEGYTALVTIDLLKNSAGCSFSRHAILQAIFSSYKIALIDMVPIVKAKYASNNTEVINCLKTLYIGNNNVGIKNLVDVIMHYRYVANKKELAQLLYEAHTFFRGYPEYTQYAILRGVKFNVPNENEDMANAFIYLKVMPLEILRVFQSMSYHDINTENAIALARVAKYINVSREDFASFLKRRPEYTATIVLDALQAVYG